MISSAQPVQAPPTSSSASGSTPTTAFPSTQDFSTPRKQENGATHSPPSTLSRSSHMKRREPYERMNPPPIPHRRTQSLQSSFFQSRQQSPPSATTAPLTQPTQEIMISRHYLIGNVCFTNFLQGPSNRFTTLMTETLECGYCRESFTTLDDLKKHLVRASHPVWICCHNLYRNKRLRDNHRRDYSCQEGPVPGNCGLAAFYEPPGKGEFTTSMKNGRCGYCEKETGSTESLREHLVDEGLKFMGHEVWYAYGRFFKESKDMERWTEFCEMGNEDDAVWANAEAEFNGSGGGTRGVTGDRGDREIINGSGAVGTTTKRRRTISNGGNAIMTGMS